MSGSKWCLTWRHVAHTSRPLTQEPKSRRSRWMDLRKEKQEEEVTVSSEGERTGVRRTRPTERAKEKEKGEKENMKAKENSEEKELRG